DGTVLTSVDVVHPVVKGGRRPPLPLAAVGVENDADARRVSQRAELEIGVIGSVKLDELLDEVLADLALRIYLFDQLCVGHAHGAVDGHGDLPDLEFGFHDDVGRVDVVGEVKLPASTGPGAATDPDHDDIA